MINIIGSRFEVLRSHTALVVTISEEKLIYEANLKLIMARVNAATSLLKWAQGEGNPALHDTVEKLYDISLMWSTVQKQFAEQCLPFSKSLNEILQVEQGLDAIRKQHQNVKDDIDKLQKQADSLKKKGDPSKFNEIEEEIFKKSYEEEELAAEIQVKFVKGEIFKAKVIKGSLLELMETYKENSAKINSLSNAAKEVISSLPDVPKHLSTEYKYQKDQHSKEAVNQLAEELGIKHMISSLHCRPISKTNEVEKQIEKKKKKRVSKIPSPLSSNFPITKMIKKKHKLKSSSSEDDHHVAIPSSPPVQLHHPTQSPPQLPMESRARSQSSKSEEEVIYQSIEDPVTSAAPIYQDSDDDDDDNYEEPGYIKPNLFRQSGLLRCASDGSLPRGSKGHYAEPLDKTESIWGGDEDAGDFDTHLYDTPYDCFTKVSDVDRTDVTFPPPKPKRSIIQDAVYINTEDVEKLLQEFYEDSSVKDKVKPAVRRRVFKKISQEKLSSIGRNDDLNIAVDGVDARLAKTADCESLVEDGSVNAVAHKKPVKPDIKQRVFPKIVESKSGSELEKGSSHGAKIELHDNSSVNDDNKPVTVVKRDIKRKPEKRVRSKIRSFDLDLAAADGSAKDTTEIAPHDQVSAEEWRDTGNKGQREKPPRPPFKIPDKSNNHEDKASARDSSCDSRPKDVVTSSTSNVKDLRSVFISKVTMSKPGKPLVPPRPSQLP